MHYKTHHEVNNELNGTFFAMALLLDGSGG
jgi:hypothetical protein